MPVIFTPGTAFEYNSGNTLILGEIVRKTSGLSLDDFAEEYLFSPLGITSYQWTHCRNAGEVTFASGGLYLRPRDMAKFGQLFLQDGVWEGNRIISSEWIEASVKESIPLPVSMRDRYHAYGYGYQWWLETYNYGNINAYSARGWGNQYIVILPEANMVVVVTGGAYDVDMFNVPVKYYDIVDAALR